MSMRMLLDGDFDRYFDPARTEGAMWIFQHVPKTAGSSLRAELVKAFGEPDEETNIHIDGTDPAQPFHARLDAAVADFIRRASSRPYRFVSGHIFERHVSRLRETFPSSRVLTFLRDPVARVISDYRYQRSSLHPGNAAFRDAFPTLEAYLEQPGESDKMARYLLPHTVMRSGDIDRGVDYMMDNFDFIGLQDEYQEFFHLLSRLLPLPPKAVAAQRRNPPTLDNPAIEGDGVAARIIATNTFDLAIMEKLRPRLVECRTQFNAWLSRNR